jgi:hypothetical protein
MPDLSPIVEPLVTIVGVVLIIAATFALVANLLLDLWKLIRQAPPEGLDSASVSGLGDWIEKLPERYLVPTIILLLGVLLADPTLFATYGDALFGSAPTS